MSALQVNTTGDLTLFALLLSCKSKGRNIKQYDIMFGAGRTIDDLLPHVQGFWFNSLVNDLGAKIQKINNTLNGTYLQAELKAALQRRDKVNVHAWAALAAIGDYRVHIKAACSLEARSQLKLYFVNPGCYRKEEFSNALQNAFVMAGQPDEAMEKVKALQYFNDTAAPEADDVICVSNLLGSEYVLELEPIKKAGAEDVSSGLAFLG